MRIQNVLLFMLLLAPLGLAGAQSPPVISVGFSARLYSDVLKEERTVLVGLPRTFESTSKKYPVLFLLDGEDHFEDAVSAVRFLSSVDNAPEMIVVGIPNNARLRDLSPPTDLPEEVALGTGGDAFLDFIVKELTPWLETHYRAAPLRILFGHSRGGLINLHALLTRPAEFRAHIAASPYFGWSKERMIQRSVTELAAVTGNHYLYMTAGDQEPDILGSVVKLTKVLASKAPKGLEWRYEHLPGENHGSTPYLTLYKGLRGLFANWTPTALVESGNVEGFLNHYSALSREYNYEVVPTGLTFYNLGNALLEKGKAAQAVEVFERAAKLYPRNRYMYESLSEALQKAGRHQDAMRAFNTAYELGRDSVSAEDRKFLEERRSELSESR